MVRLTGTESIHWATYWNLDMNFYKTFKLTERFGLQFRGEFYTFQSSQPYVTTETST